MNKTGRINRITALLLIAMMALSMTGYAFESVYADDLDGQNVEAAETAENTGTDPDEEAVSGSGQASASDEEESVDAAEPEAEVRTQEVQAAEGSQEAAITGKEDPAPPVGSITLNAVGEDGSIYVVWKTFVSDQYSADQIYYMVYLDDSETGARVDGSCRYTVAGVDTGSAHKITVRAYTTKPDDPPQQGGGDAGAAVDPQPEPSDREILLAEGSIESVGMTKRVRISDNSRSASNLGINLKNMIGEPYNGYSVVQGGCTDGTYAYYLMVSGYNQNARILKTRVGDNAFIAASGVIDIEHGNGMAMDTDNHRVVISNREGWRNKLITVDADSLGNVQYYDASYGSDASAPWYSTRGNGIGAIAYVSKYRCFIALQRETHDLLVLDQSFNVIGFIGTKITAKYPGMYQAMDADERYVYLLLSPYGKQKENRILALDWNPENLGINAAWKCNNDLGGTPDADIILNTPYEAENIYHIDQGDGTAHFYLSEYYNNPQTKWVKKKQPYKVKWKKVKKKVKVKWKKVKKKVKWKKVKKRVKVNGKWKTKTVWKYKTKKVWKYKYKWKKVWKYKTKYREVTVKDGSYLNRDDYVYDLGIM